MLAGVPSWIGLSKARLHPALALCFVVPLLPAQPPKSRPKQLPALHAFEHSLKGFVDFGLFFFTLANAGVPLSGGGGPLTVTVLAALVLGKLLGVTLLVLSASRLNLAPVNSQIRPRDVAMVASMASVGLTVALFVSGEAFRNDPRLQGEAKLGALLSGLMGFVCVGLAKLPCMRFDAVAPATPAGGKKLPKMVSDSKLRASTIMLPDGSFAAHEDSFVISSTPAAQSLGYRQPQYYKHAIRAGDNRLSMHPDLLDQPSLFAMDPEASLRARDRWRSARLRSASVLPLEERSERNAKGVVSFLQKSASERRLSVGVPLGALAGAAAQVAPAGVAAGAAALAEADAVTTFAEPAPVPAPAPAAAPAADLPGADAT